MKKLLVYSIIIASTAFAQQVGVRTGFNFYNVFWKGKPTGIDGFASLGKGVGAGITTVIPITKSLSFYPELNLYYRNTYNNELDCNSVPKKYEKYCEMPSGVIAKDFIMRESLDEWVWGIPLLLKYTLNSNFYMTGGVQLNFSYSAFVTRELTGPSWMVAGALYGWQEVAQLGTEVGTDLKYKYRSPIDVGVALGCGYHITENFAVDFRLVTDITNISTKGVSKETKDMEKGPERSGKIREENDGSYPINPFSKNKGTWLVQYGIGLNYFL